MTLSDFDIKIPGPENILPFLILFNEASPSSVKISNQRFIPKRWIFAIITLCL